MFIVACGIATGSDEILIVWPKAIVIRSFGVEYGFQPKLR
jgi:hypothetical protein